MASNRVDQVSLPGALKNHERRISILEATPQFGGLCSDFSTWDVYGATLLGVDYHSNSGCGSLTPPGDPDSVDGYVWACGTDDASAATNLIVGSVRIVMGTPGSIDSSDCTGSNHVIQYPYVFTPPFWQSGENMGFNPGVLFGSGFSIQTSTGMSIPSGLHAAGDSGWNVRVAGVDYPNGNGTGDTFARPKDTASGGAPAYPFDWAEGDVLFDGWFAYFVQVGD